MNFKPFGSTGAVEGFCIIKAVEKKMTAKGAPFLDMTLADADGEINAKLWDYKEPTVKYHVYDFVKVRGSLVAFNDTQQLRIDRIRPVLDTDNVKIEDYVESADFSGEAMLRQIENTVNDFTDDELKKLVMAVIDKNRENLLIWPAALKLHHAIRCGLLMHTLTILRLAKGVASVYPFINTDLLYSGIILHDIAKIREIKVSNTGIASDYSAEGNLLGHLVMGAMEIEKTGAELGISEEKRVLIEHMLISHHGQPEFGAAQYPMFLEAEILSELDLMDARIFEMNKAVRDVKPGDFTPRQWALDNRKLYNHGLSGESKVNLID